MRQRSCNCSQAIETISLHCQLACIWEATARKPGNVHRYQDFDDLSYLDFITSAAAIASAFHAPHRTPLGELVRNAIASTRTVTASNTNLGLVLLLAPLAKAAAEGCLRDDLPKVLAGTTVADAAAVYEAIRLAAPAGLGRVDEQDIRQEPTLTLGQVMALAAERDMVARQYANGFQEVLQDGVPALQEGLNKVGTLEGAIIACHLHLLALHPDSLIARKCGRDIAEAASFRAAKVVDAGWPHTAAACRAIAELDVWLRADGHRRNPGTTADLVAASLFVALRQGIITLPPQVRWSASSDHCAKNGPTAS